MCKFNGTEVFDFETLNSLGEVSPYSISYTYDGDVRYFVFENNSPEYITSYIFANFKGGCIYYAHNLIFDFLLFFKGFISLKVDFNWFFLEYNLYEVTASYNGKSINFRCSYKLLPFSLERFYPALTDRPKMPFPHKDLTRDNLSLKCGLFGCIGEEYSRLTLGDYLRVYAINDCLMLRQGLLCFFKELDALGISYSKKSLTCGSIAMSYYVKKYNQINLNLQPRFSNVIKNAYYGGRCEVFGNLRDGEKLLHFDFKGMYQGCMMESLPYGNFRYESGDLDLNVPGFYYVVINARSKIPVLPLRESKLNFKCGVIRGWYWHEEILSAISNCEVRGLEVKHGIISESNGSVLSGFIGDLNQLREKGLLKREIGKLLINSFYGRLALAGDFTLLKLTDALHDESSYGRIGDFFLVKKKIKSRPKSNIAVAAAITSKARIKLYKAFLEVHKSGGRVLYCDTDSVFAAFPKNADVENRLLGDFVFFDTKRSDTVILDAVFVNPKTYALVMADGREVIRIKGVNTDTVSFTNLKSSFYSSADFITVNSENFFTKDLKLTKALVEKDIVLQSYTKRKWSKDLKDTSPHMVED